MSETPTDTRMKQATPDAASRRRRRASIALGVIAVIVLLAALSGIAVGIDPVCAGCHQEQARALVRTAHANVACEACHFSARGQLMSRLDVVLRMVPASIRGVRLAGPGRPIADAACRSCHSSEMVRGVIRQAGYSIDHTTCVSGQRCDECHGNVGHGSATRFVRTARMDGCVSCHRARSGPLGCSTCHAEKTAANITDPEWKRTHGADWKMAHGTGDLQGCSACHAGDFCKPCHKVDFPHPMTIAVTHGALARADGIEACTSCHTQSTFCDSCHGGIPMPHPAGFLQRHSCLALSLGQPKCETCHEASDCTDCHLNHVHPGGPRVIPGRADVSER